MKKLKQKDIDTRAFRLLMYRYDIFLISELNNIIKFSDYIFNVFNKRRILCVS